MNRIRSHLIHHHLVIPSQTITLTWAALYVLSGICQPMLMTLCQTAGLANHQAQLYMFFYYLGPSLLLGTLKREEIPPRRVLVKACGIAALDIVAQTLNYTGNALAGPTVFAIIYSSVTIWTAVFSRLLLKRSLSHLQWMAVWIVFGGLCLTATNSLQLGANVAYGTSLVVMGSSLHGLAYVFSEAILTVSSSSSSATTSSTSNDGDSSDTSQLLIEEQEEPHPPLSPRQNAAIQGTVACVALGIWQFWYTIPNWEVVMGKPLQQAGTSLFQAGFILSCFALANLIHSVTFSHTLKYYPGGATSAGVMKGLQAVLVFVAAHVFYCGRVGGAEMCFTPTKLVSLITVTGGVLWFGILTQQQHGGGGAGSRSNKEGYSSIDCTMEEGQELVVHV